MMLHICPAERVRYKMFNECQPYEDIGECMNQHYTDTEPCICNSKALGRKEKVLSFQTAWSFYVKRWFFAYIHYYHVTVYECWSLQKNYIVAMTSFPILRMFYSILSRKCYKVLMDRNDKLVSYLFENW